MGLTIGSLHMMGTLTQEQQAANPYRYERDGRVSLYENGWDNPLALYADAETLSRETGKDVLAFYCSDEDAVALALYRNGKTVPEGVSSLDEGLFQPPKNMGLIAAAYGAEDAGGAELERLMTDVAMDTMQQIDELAAYLKLPLLPDAALAEQMENGEQERKRPAAAQRLDAGAQEKQVAERVGGKEQGNMRLTIGSLHMMGTLTQEQQAANPYRLERDGRVSLYDNSGWDIWNVLLWDAAKFSCKTGKDMLVFYCYNEDAVALVLYRGGKAVAGGASSLDERLAQPPQNMGLIAEAFGVEDAGGATLERLMTDARADVMQQIGELAAYLKLPLLPDAALAEQMEADKREWRQKYPTAAKRLDAEAQKILGERMAALGFTTFKYHRWYKLIRDEVLLSFGLVPYKGSFDMLIGIQPTFVPYLDSFMTEKLESLPYVMRVQDTPNEMQKWRRDSRSSYCIFSCDELYLTKWARYSVKEIFGQVVEPMLRRITNVRDAVMEIQWWTFVNYRRYDCSQQASEREWRPPTVENYKLLREPVNIVFNQYCFFRMYEELWHKTLRDESGYSVSRPTPGVRGWDDYEGMERVIEAKENKREEYLLLKNRDEAAIEERLRRAYEENLKLIKRRLKLTPDCSDTIWDRDYRHPYDIKQMLQERYERCAPRMHEGDYTIDFI